jgi:hypothetical protein
MPDNNGESVWRPGARMARMRSSHNYGAVILFAVGSFVFIAAAPDKPWTAGVLLLMQCATFLVALWTSGLGQERRPVIPIAMVAISLAAAIYILETDTATGLSSILDALLIIATIVAVGVGIVDQRQVNVKSITGALCVYLLLGMIFNFIYSALAVLGDGPFFASGSDGTPFERVYFSYVTLATLGYGDYTAGGTLGRSLAVAEVLLGQLFLVTAVALLVGLLIAGRREPPEGGR